MSKHIKNAVIRGGIPLLIMSGISLVMKLQGMDAFQVRSTFITGLIVTAVAAASVVYEVEGWTLLKQSLAHFLLMLVTVFPCLLLSGWFPVRGFVDVLKVLGMFVLAGAALWGIGYVVFTKMIRSKK